MSYDTNIGTGCPNIMVKHCKNGAPFNKCILWWVQKGCALQLTAVDSRTNLKITNYYHQCYWHYHKSIAKEQKFLLIKKNQNKD